ncbi:MAG: hypothetical protein JWR36_79 [Glaciihabitans sp.]|nr:hypothetical protein [Glaciihabitans sp.]
MRKRGGPVGTTLAVSIALALTACVPSPHTVTPTPEATATPVFASDAQALAAAKAAYEGYLAASNLVAHSGAKDTSPMRRWESARQYSKDSKSFEELIIRREHTSGNSTFSRFTLQRVETNSDGTVTVGIYVCLNIEKARVLDQHDRDVTPHRPELLPLQLTFISGVMPPTSLLLDRSQVWPGNNSC